MNNKERSKKIPTNANYIFKLKRKDLIKKSMKKSQKIPHKNSIKNLSIGILIQQQQKNQGWGGSLSVIEMQEEQDKSSPC